MDPSFITFHIHMMHFDYIHSQLHSLIPPPTSIDPLVLPTNNPEVFTCFLLSFDDMESYTRVSHKRMGEGCFQKLRHLTSDYTTEEYVFPSLSTH